MDEHRGNNSSLLSYHARPRLALNPMLGRTLISLRETQDSRIAVDMAVGIIHSVHLRGTHSLDLATRVPPRLRPYFFTTVIFFASPTKKKNEHTPLGTGRIAFILSLCVQGLP